MHVAYPCHLSEFESEDDNVTEPVFLPLISDAVAGRFPDSTTSRYLSDNRYRLVNRLNRRYRELMIIYLLPFPLYFLSPPELSLPLSVTD